jgi:hypothetical protein
VLRANKAGRIQVKRNGKVDSKVESKVRVGLAGTQRKQKLDECLQKSK